MGARSKVCFGIWDERLFDALVKRIQVYAVAEDDPCFVVEIETALLWMRMTKIFCNVVCKEYGRILFLNIYSIVLDV